MRAKIVFKQKTNKPITIEGKSLCWSFSDEWVRFHEEEDYDNTLAIIEASEVLYIITDETRNTVFLEEV